MLRMSTKEKDGGPHAASLSVPAAGETQSSQSARGNSKPAAVTTRFADGRRSSEHRRVSAQEHDRLAPGRRSLEQQRFSNSQDDRLAELEKALTATKEEVAILRNELDRVKQDAQASAEVSRYQAQHHVPSEDAQMQTESVAEISDESLNQALEQNRNLQSDLIAQNHTARYRLAELQEQVLSQQTHQEHRYSDSDWNALTLRLHETEKESHARLQQLLSLKSSISLLTRTDSQVSDAELAEGFLQLANRVREWVVSNYRRSKMSFDGLPAASVRVLQTIKTDFETIDVADKLQLYQAVVSRILMQIFDEPLVVGMPDTGFCTGLRGFAERVSASNFDIRDWKRATLQLVKRNIPTAELRSWRDDRLGFLAHELESVMSSISSTEITSNSRSALIGILNAVADLQRTLCLQRAGYTVISFDAPEGDCLEDNHRFDNRTMEPINDVEDSMDEANAPFEHHVFVFCVFPCLEKAGGDIENIVFKARVCCGVG